jgi:hypothetical protein
MFIYDQLRFQVNIISIKIPINSMLITKRNIFGWTVVTILAYSQ